ncbi:hypothetical protein [Mycolicibacterium smegmatis]|uniref:hypothetical protein n=1 Tax=Mycolicibacterium smegmatis TaxID=1772 RepID=UPI001EFA9EAB|nr:hypothetical protein [Mycolicibacterium smegmatis]ULN34183.1 hypothetical protein KZ781_25925 [Mycolicibacterium smegmatis]
MKGEWSASLKNWGTELVLGAEIIGYNCTLHFDSQKLARIEPKQEVEIGVDVDPADAAVAWVSIHWSTPTMRNTMAGAWFPVSERGALAMVYLTQMRRNSLQQFMARRMFGKVATPVSVPTSRYKAPKLHEPIDSAALFDAPSRPRFWRLRARWLQLWARAFRITAPPEAWRALTSVEQQLKERLSRSSDQPGDPAPDDEVDRLQRVFDNMGVDPLENLPTFDPFKNLPTFDPFKNVPDPMKTFDQIRRPKPRARPEPPGEDEPPG